MANPFSTEYNSEEVQKKKKPLKRTISQTGPEENQIMTFVTPKLDEEEWQEISTYLQTVIQNGTRERAELDRNLLVWNDLYEGKVPEAKDTPWPDSSNLHIPITQEMLDGLHSRLAKAAQGVSPLALVKGQDELATEVEYKLERYYEALADSIDLGEILNQAIFLALRDGVGLVKIMWEHRTRKVKTRKMKPLIDPETGQTVIDPLTGKPQRQEVVEIDDVVDYDNVRAVPVELKDFYLLPAHAYGLDRYYAKGCAERVWMRWDEIYQRGQSGDYDKDQVEALRDATTGSRIQSTGSSANLEVDTIGGQVQISQTPGFQEYEIFEVFMNYDLDNDGYEEECLFTYAPRFNVLLRAEVFPYWHQLRPYVAFIPWPRPRRFYGFSVPQRLESVNRELNAIHNQRIDAVTLRLSPPLLITRGAVLRGDSSQPWGPTARFEVNEKDEVLPLTLPDINPSSFSEENILRQYGERIIGLYDVNTPRGTGARRTRAEIGAIQQEGLVRFDYMMKIIQRAVVKVFEQIHQLKIQYMSDDGEDFEARGTDAGAAFHVAREELLANIKFIANGDLPVADKERNREEAYFLYGALMQNPLVVMRPDRVHAVTKNFLQAFEVKNIDKVIGTTEEMQQQMMAEQQAQQAASAMGVPAGGPTNGETRKAGPGRSRAGAGMAGPTGAAPGA